MTLTQDNGGTRLSSTRYVHYGTITTRRAYFVVRLSEFVWLMLTMSLASFLVCVHSQDWPLGGRRDRVHHHVRY